MAGPSYNSFQERVTQAAEAVLQRDGSVGPLELFQQMRWLHPVHFDGWRQGNEHYRVLEEWIQVGPEKLQKTINYFQQWVRERGMRPIEAHYVRRGVQGVDNCASPEAATRKWKNSIGRTTLPQICRRRRPRGLPTS